MTKHRISSHKHISVYLRNVDRASGHNSLWALSRSQVLYIVHDRRRESNRIESIDEPPSRVLCQAHRVGSEEKQAHTDSLFASAASLSLPRLFETKASVVRLAIVGVLHSGMVEFSFLKWNCQPACLPACWPAGRPAGLPACLLFTCSTCSLPYPRLAANRRPNASARISNGETYLYFVRTLRIDGDIHSLFSTFVTFCQRVSSKQFQPPR